MPTALDFIDGRTHSLRNFEPDDFHEALAGEFERPELRQALRFIEAERFYAMLKPAHKMAVHLDLDELRAFVDANPWLVEWVNVYAELEEVRPLE